MSYGRTLLTAALAVSQSGYRLAQWTGIAESHINEARRGKRKVAPAWVLPLAEIAGVDPVEAMRQYLIERGAKDSQRSRISTAPKPEDS